MYGSHHRVASLRRGACDWPPSQSATQCDAHSWTPHPTQTESLSATQRRAPYAVPEALRHSRLAPPPALTQPQVQPQPQPQPHVQESPEAVAALRAVSEALAQQQKQMAAGCQSLAMLAALVNEQRAQVAALNGLASEVRAVAGAIRDAAKTTTTTTKTKTAEEGPKRRCVGTGIDKCVGRSVERPHSGQALLVLGGNDSDAEDSGEENNGAAYAPETQLRAVVLKNTRNVMQFVEDDVFSM